MNRMKKMLAALLCLAMCFSLFPGYAFAVEDEPGTETGMESPKLELSDEILPDPGFPDEESLEEADYADDSAAEEADTQIPIDPESAEPEEQVPPEESEPEEGGETPTEAAPDIEGDIGADEENEPDPAEDPEVPEGETAPELPEEDAEQAENEEQIDDAEEENEEVDLQSTYADAITAIGLPLGTHGWALPTVDGGVFTQNTYADKILVIVNCDQYNTGLVQNLVACSWPSLDEIQLVFVEWSSENSLTNAQKLIPSLGGNTDIVLACDGNSMIWDLFIYASGGARTLRSSLCMVIADGSIQYMRTGCIDGEDVTNTVAAYTGMERLGDVPARELSLNVDYHSEEEIAAFLESHPASNMNSSYAVLPSLKEPYSPGELSEATQENAVNWINQIRYIAGLNADVTWSREYADMAQASSMMNCLNGSLSHYPRRPAVLSDPKYDALVELGQAGASRSNIFMSTGMTNLAQAILMGWMADDDAYNIPMVGHRRWILNPSMDATGFGQYGSYCSMYAFGRGGSGSQTNVAWPAQNTPVQYFNALYPWNLSLGFVVDQSATTVTLTRKTDGKVWRFSSSSSDGYFNVNNDGYGLTGCIIFRPNGLGAVTAKDSFDVEVNTVINGTTKLHIAYTVNFFSIHVHQTALRNAKAPSCKEEGYTGDEVCTICGRVITAGSPIAKLAHTPGSVSRETLKKPTCTEEGVSAELIRCSVCGEELSRETKPLAKSAHTAEKQNVKQATATEPGYSGDEICTVCGKLIRSGTATPTRSEAERMPVLGELRFDREYLALEPGQSAQLTLIGLPAEWKPYLEWSVLDASNEPVNALVRLNGNGKVTAEDYGTAYIVASVFDGSGSTYSARCRVDVLDKVLQQSAEISVVLPVTMVTSELYQTDYAKVSVVLRLVQNITAAGVTTADGTELEDTGVMIQSARFVGNANARLDIRQAFGLRVADDRTLEIVPTIDVMDQKVVQGVAGSYRSKIELTLSDGSTVETPELTVTVRKTKPMPTAAAIRLNGFIVGSSAPVVLNGGYQIAEVVSYTAPSCASFDKNTMMVSVKGQGSGQLVLNCRLDGWTGVYTVRAMVMCLATRPALRVMPMMLSLKSGTNDRATAQITVTPANFNDGNYSLSVEATGDAAKYVNFTVDEDGWITAELKPGTDLNTKQAKTFRVNAVLSVGSNKVTSPITIRTIPEMVKVTMMGMAAGFIDTAMPKSPITLTPRLVNYNVAGAALSLTFTKTLGRDTITLTEAEANALFNVEWNGTAFVITGKDNAKLAADIKNRYSYSAIIEADIGTAEPIRSIATRLTIRSSARVNATMTAMASGFIDTLRPDTFVTITPRIMNCYDYDLETATVKLSSSGLDYRWEDGNLLVFAKEGGKIDTKTRNSVTISLKLGNETKTATAYPTVRMGMAQVIQSTRSVTLSKNDRYDRQIVKLSVSDPTLYDLNDAEVVLVDRSGNFQLTALGNGEYAIGYKDNKLPDNISRLSMAAVQLYVYMKGNGSHTFNGTQNGTQNALVAVTVNLK